MCKKIASSNNEQSIQISNETVIGKKVYRECRLREQRGGRQAGSAKLNVSAGISSFVEFVPTHSKLQAIYP